MSCFFVCDVCARLVGGAYGRGCTARLMADGYPVCYDGEEPGDACDGFVPRTPDARTDGEAPHGPECGPFGGGRE